MGLTKKKKKCSNSSVDDTTTSNYESNNHKIASRPKPEPTKLTEAPKTVSLKDILSGKAPATATTENVKKAEPKEVQTEKVLKPFTQDDLTAAWQNFANSIKTEKPSIYAIFQSTTPQLKDGIAIISLETQVQIEILSEIKQDLLTQLKTTLQNTNIDLQFELLATASPTSNRQRLYTAVDKFKYLVDKNSSILMLKEKLNLELD